MEWSGGSRRGKGYRRAFRRYGKPEVMYRAWRCSLVPWRLSNSGNILVRRK